LKKRSNVVPYFILGGAQIAVGAAAIFARYALGGAGPLAASASRLAIAALILLIYSVLFGRYRNTEKLPTRALTRREQLLLIAAGVALAAHFAGWIWSLEYTTVAVSTLLVTSTPVWTALYDAVVLKRPLSPLACAAFVTGAIGLLMIVGFDRTSPPHAGHELLGDILALGAGLAIGAYLILVREVRTPVSSGARVDTPLDTRRIVTQTYTWAAVTLILASAVAHQPPPPLANTSAWLGILAMALISQLLGHTAINASLKWFTPSAISFATLLEPLIAATLATIIFHEAVPPLALLGALILLVSIAIVLREEQSGTMIGELL
jgi:drug/metabolite transporter (DMT)-like permease